MLVLTWMHDHVDDGHHIRMFERFDDLDLSHRRHGYLKSSAHTLPLQNFTHSVSDIMREKLLQGDYPSTALLNALCDHTAGVSVQFPSQYLATHPNVPSPSLFPTS